MKLLEPTLESVPIARPIPSEENPQGLCLDKGYDYEDIRELALRQRFEPHIRTRGEEVELKTDHPDWKARRWVAEACHSWFNRNRGILDPLVQEGGEPPRLLTAGRRPDRLQEGARGAAGSRLLR